MPSRGWPTSRPSSSSAGRWGCWGPCRRRPSTPGGSSARRCSSATCSASLAARGRRRPPRYSHAPRSWPPRWPTTRPRCRRSPASTRAPPCGPATTVRGRWPSVCCTARGARTAHTRCLQGELVAARDHLEAAVRLAAAMPEAAQLPGTPLVLSANGLLEIVLVLLGLHDQATRVAEAASRDIQRSHHPYPNAVAMTIGVHAAVHRRDAPLLRARAAAAAALAERWGFQMLAANATALLGWAQAIEGDPAGGAARLRQALARSQATGAQATRPLLLGLLAEAEQLAGRPGEALGLLDDALAQVDRSGERYCEAELHRLKGESLLAGSPPRAAEAERAFRTAIAVAGRQGAKLLEGRATVSLGRLLAAQRAQSTRQRQPPSPSVVAKPARANSAATGPWGPSSRATRRSAPSARSASATSPSRRRPRPRRRSPLRMAMPHSSTVPAASNGRVAATPTSPSPSGAARSHSPNSTVPPGPPTVGEETPLSASSLLAASRSEGVRTRRNTIPVTGGGGLGASAAPVCGSCAQSLRLAAWRRLGGPGAHRAKPTLSRRRVPPCMLPDVRQRLQEEGCSMRGLQVDRTDHARRARMRRRPHVDLDEAVRLDDRAAVVRATAAQVTRRAARLLAASQPS